VAHAPWKPSIHWLLVFIPASFLIHYVPPLTNDIALFACSCLSMVVLSSLISTATEHLASRVGTQVGGLLNATFSNLPEGLKNGEQTFSKDRASDFSTGLIIATLALVIPTVYHQVARETAGGWQEVNADSLSLWLAVMLFAAYVGSLLYTLFVKSAGDPGAAAEESRGGVQGESWSGRKAGAVLAVSSLLIAVISDYVAGTVGVVEKAFDLTELFMGVVVIAIIGNVAAQTTAVRMAMKNKMNLSMEVAVSASSQVALLVVPLLVFASHILGHPLSLEFGGHEIIALVGAVWLTSQISNDGKCNWLNGLQMLILYAIVAVLFYFVPVDAGGVLSP